MNYINEELKILFLTKKIIENKCLIGIQKYSNKIQSNEMNKMKTSTEIRFFFGNG